MPPPEKPPPKPPPGVEPELVVLATLVGVVKHLVSLGSLLELLFRLLVARVAVGVILDGELAVSHLYLIL